MPRQSTSQLPRRHEEGFTIPLKSRGARIATANVYARSSCEIVHIDVVHLASPDFASLLSSLGHEHAMQAACRIAKYRFPGAMKLFEVERDELLSTPPHEVAQKSCSN